MIEYVVGFLFNTQRNLVVLIRKQRPDWMAGKWNGLGGKIEAGETPAAAMRREFLEEAGLEINSWEQYAVLTGEGFRVFFFRAFSPQAFEVRSRTDEMVLMFSVDAYHRQNLVTNAAWLIPMALSMDADKAAQFSIAEISETPDLLAPAC